MMHRLIAVSFSLICFLGVTLPMPAQAAMISTQQTLGTAARQQQLDAVNAWLQRDEVRSQLQALGVAPEQAAERAAVLSDSELQQLSGKIDEQPAGGDGFALLGVVFVVLLILELVGVINIFNRI